MSSPGSTRHGLHKGETLGTAVAKIAAMGSPRECGVENETQAAGGRDPVGAPQALKPAPRPACKHSICEPRDGRLLRVLGDGRLRLLRDPNSDGDCRKQLTQSAPLLLPGQTAYLPRVPNFANYISYANNPLNPSSHAHEAPLQMNPG